MDSKKLAKLIKVIVEAEVAKKHEQFLSKTFPKILDEEVNKRLNAILEVKGGVVASSARVVEEEVDPFQRAEALLQQGRQQPKKQFTKNTAINEILNQTKPFTKEQRAGGSQVKSVLDNFKPIQESYVPNYMEAEPDIDETISFSSNTAPMGIDSMRAQMTAKMGYGEIANHPSKGGLGVTTGLPGLDRILNRDNSELVKRFKK